jgi:hypothetical protein
MTHLKSSVLAVTLLTLPACAARQGAPGGAGGPEQTVAAFLDAVRSNSIGTMAAYWGTSAGPASNSMPRDELEKRLTVMRVYLAHERYEFVSSDLAPGESNRRTVRARLTRSSCTPVVPFTLVRYRQGWLVENVDLTAVGNPTQVCQPGTR